MKKLGLFYVTAVVLGLVFAVRSHATVISANTAISPLNTNYDGADLVVSNCTVTMDGTHAFNSLTIATNGVLTHSCLTNGSATILFGVVYEVQVVNGPAPVTLLHSNVFGQVTVRDMNTLALYANGTDYIQNNLPDGTTQLSATQFSSIPSNTPVYVSYQWSYTYSAGLNLVVNNGVNVTVGGSINLNGNGYASAAGTGHGANSIGTFPDGSGAGHGGNGGMSLSNAVGGTCYDSLYSPTNLGSGGGAGYGGAGANGGGKVQIVAGGTVNVDGVITANGADATNSRAGGGAGGSIWIVATNFSGAGSLIANGGAGEPTRGGGGGGGRISIQCGTNIFSGNVTAYGGNGAKIGGAGTIYTQTNGLTGLLLVDNGGRAGTNSIISLATSADVLIRNGAIVKPTPFTPRNLVIGTNGTLSPPNSAAFNFNVTGNLTIQAGGALLLDSFGSAPGTGIGTGVAYNIAPYPCGGAGNGGAGGMGNYPAAWGGGANGIQLGPIAIGGGGGSFSTFSTGGAGGGAVQINVTGTLQVDGRISANAGDGSGSGGGGGAGGSIYINHCTTLTGTGSITANGGAGVPTGGGGGGGGRIAILSDRANNFSGVISAYGGNGAMAGGAGVIYTSFANSPGTILQLIVDNGGRSGTNTPVQTLGTGTLIVRNGGHVTASSGTTFAGLLVTTNGWLTPLPGVGMSLTINGNATIQPGGGFMGDQLGHGSGQGSGVGSFSTVSPYYAGGGGAYGGKGGNSISNLAFGGTSGGDTAANPSAIYAGSGGNGTSPSFGGISGGFLQMTVSGTLQLDGFLTANGGNGSGNGGGGGSGGGVNVSAGSFSGGGSITVNGGAGANGFGGGGGGGRIAVTFSSKNFTGSLSAIGGGGANYGGGGTIYFKTNTAARGQVVIDNAGHVGADTTWNNSGSADLTLLNGAFCYLPSGTSTFGNLLVGSNCLVIISNSTTSSSATINAINVTIQAGGSINSDSNGYASSTTSTGAGIFYGSSPQYAGGGGAHGGYGAASAGNLAAGGTYMDTMNNPTSPGGGGGGNSSNTSLGGRGGGVVILSVSGYLQVDGMLSANGGNGSGVAGGGGAGGSLNITCPMLTGGGSILANGGYGVGANGGGGSGGMIYANYTSNIFSGTILAAGGGGAGYGGAGSIYFRTNTTGQTTLIVDNGGHSGTNTPLATATSFILRNGATAFQAFPPQSVNNLLITSNAWLVGNNAPGNNYRGLVNLTAGNAVIQAGGGISGDGGGNTQNTGNGAGFFQNVAPFYQCGGGSHGGDGAGFTNENNAFDSTTSPSVVGSGGGGFQSFSSGGSGGGYLRFIALNSLQLDGVVTANGANGGGIGGGGGAGGSIYLSAPTFGGAGTITANGGNGTTYGGGGGGGRIAIYFNNNNFTGGCSAYGGGGINCGGAGTIYTKTNNQSLGQLLLDNGTNNPGAGTTFEYVAADVTIQSNATAVLTTSGLWSPHNVLIRTNALLLPLPAQQISVNDLTIDPGGVVRMDGNGFTSFGLGYPLSTGGGGHGGYGTGNPSGYGNAFDTIQTPSSPGGHGSNGSSGQGGPGGGVLTLSVNGTLTVNGRISANGINGYANSGGGAGGSLYFPHINRLTGNGIIAANGGSSGVTFGSPVVGTGGSGGGGRISITCNTNTFTGQITAFGGGGLYPASAGTVFTRVNGVQTLLVDNGGLVATNTPLGNSFVMPAAPFDLNISGGAIVAPLTPLPLINNLNLATGSVLTMQAAGSNLVVAVQHDANIAGNITLDYLGYQQSKGSGAGGSIDAKGGGGGYGGAGGNASSGSTGGITNGSATQPTDFGSGGGAGLNSLTGGSEGGGAVRLSVGGTLNLNGNLTANGDYGWQDDSGGGAGGSVWITANTVTGTGILAAIGGNGDLWNGGGGGGGRIALYSPNNLFAGITNVIGGFGGISGQPGSVFLASVLPDFSVLSQSPTGAVNNTVSSINLSFSEAVDPASLTSAAFTFTTPAGVMNPTNLSIATINSATIRISFPLQNLIGNYSLQVAPVITNILGTVLAQPFTGNFSISLPTISGTVSDTNGAPVAGVTVQPDGGLIGTTTDANGNYAIGVPPGWYGGITPAFGSFMFIPGTLTYTNVTAAMTNQNYLMVTTVAPNIAASPAGTNLSLNWTGMNGVTYQTWSSTNLTDWTIYGSAIPGTNGPMQVTLPLDGSPAVFFRLGAAH